MPGQKVESERGWVEVDDDKLKKEMDLDDGNAKKPKRRANQGKSSAEHKSQPTSECSSVKVNHVNSMGKVSEQTSSRGC